MIEGSPCSEKGARAMTAARFWLSMKPLPLGLPTLPAKPTSLHRSGWRGLHKRLRDWRWRLFYDHAAQLYRRNPTNMSRAFGRSDGNKAGSPSSRIHLTIFALAIVGDGARRRRSGPFCGGRKSGQI
jgi:hypothetical protein